jgi:hypothetical protein
MWTSSSRTAPDATDIRESSRSSGSSRQAARRVSLAQALYRSISTRPRLLARTRQRYAEPATPFRRAAVAGRRGGRWQRARRGEPRRAPSAGRENALALLDGIPCASRCGRAAHLTNVIEHAGLQLTAREPQVPQTLARGVTTRRPGADHAQLAPQSRQRIVGAGSSVGQKAATSATMPTTRCRMLSDGFSRLATPNVLGSDDPA